MEIEVDLENLQDFANKIAKFIDKGDVILMNGDLGSGKTTLSKMIISKIAPEITEISSPTYNIIHSYEREGLSIYHIDLYRIKNRQELFELGILELIENGFSIIEWPDIIKFSILENYQYLNIDIACNYENNSRKYKVSGSDKWKIFLQKEYHHERQ